MSELISEAIKAGFNEIAEQTNREKEGIKLTAIKEATSQIQPILASKDAEIARLQTELTSKSGPAFDGESAEDFANRVGFECIDYLKRRLGYL